MSLPLSFGAQVQRYNDEKVLRELAAIRALPVAVAAREAAVANVAELFNPGAQVSQPAPQITGPGVYAMSALNAEAPYDYATTKTNSGTNRENARGLSSVESKTRGWDRDIEKGPRQKKRKRKK